MQKQATNSNNDGAINSSSSSWVFTTDDKILRFYTFAFENLYFISYALKIKITNTQTFEESLRKKLKNKKQKENNLNKIWDK